MVFKRIKRLFKTYIVWRIIYFGGHKYKISDCEFNLKGIEVDKPSRRKVIKFGDSLVASFPKNENHDWAREILKKEKIDGCFVVTHLLSLDDGSIGMLVTCEDFVLSKMNEELKNE